MAKSKNAVPKAPATKKEVALPKCGIVMPISTIDGCPAEHWADVLSIINDAVKSVGFDPNLVSNANESGIIQQRIIQNLYNNEIVVCDVSCKNPNVMFELGLRLAFDKPTVVIKDDQTDYSFDTSPIEHLTYRRDLRFQNITLFKDNLAKKVESTYRKSIEDPDYSTFLKNFGEYKVSKLESNEVSSDKYILKALEDLRIELSQIKTSQPNRSMVSFGTARKVETLAQMFRRLENYIGQFCINYDLSTDEISNNAKHRLDFLHYVQIQSQADGMPIAEEKVFSFLDTLPFYSSS